MRAVVEARDVEGVGHVRALLHHVPPREVGDLRGVGRPEVDVRRHREVPVTSVAEAGSYLRLTDSCITQLKAQGPSRTCNESKEEEVTGYKTPGLMMRLCCEATHIAHAFRA